MVYDLKIYFVVAYFVDFLSILIYSIIRAFVNTARLHFFLNLFCVTSFYALDQFCRLLNIDVIASFFFILSKYNRERLVCTMSQNYDYIAVYVKH